VDVDQSAAVLKWEAPRSGACLLQGEGGGLFFDEQVELQYKTIAGFVLTSLKVQ
jgi:hypothetical protein